MLLQSELAHWHILLTQLVPGHISPSVVWRYMLLPRILAGEGGSKYLLNEISCTATPRTCCVLSICKLLERQCLLEVQSFFSRSSPPTTGKYDEINQKQCRQGLTIWALKAGNLWVLVFPFIKSLMANKIFYPLWAPISVSINWKWQ